jgi:hypothetical protein
MARYNYTCTGNPRCKVKNITDNLRETLIVCIGDLDTEAHTGTQADLMVDDKPKNTDPEESFLVWEVSHGMFEDVKVKCPVCNADATKSYADYFFQGYVRGNGYFDRAGCRRDMNLYKLLKDDPYGRYRLPGEAEHLADKLRAAGKHNPKRQYFT